MNSKLKDEDLKILDVNKPKDNYICVHENLPLVPSLVCLISPPSSGKSILLVNWVYRFYKDIFTGGIYWCSPTLNLDNSLESSVKKDETIVKITEADDLKNLTKFINILCEEQKQKIEEGEQLEEILIILDDCISFINSKSLYELCTMYRHYRITVWISIQKMKLLNPTIRSCASDIITFEISNKQLKLFLDEFDNYNNIEHFYNKCCSERFNWLRLNKGCIYHGSPDGIIKVYDKNTKTTHENYKQSDDKKKRLKK